MSKLAVIDRDGWRKEFPLSKPITFVGSDPADDIVLEAARGGGVSPRHAQIILQGGGGRVITLGGPITINTAAGGQAVQLYTATPLNNGDRLAIGEFQIVFMADAAAPVYAPAPVAVPAFSAPIPAITAPATASTPVSSAAPAAVPATPVPKPVAGMQAPAPSVVEAPSPSIGVRLTLPPTPLAPDQPLEGTVTIRNQGARPGAQFRLQVDGLDADCCEIGPGPMLFPNAEKDVFLRISHPRRPYPPAGNVTITVRATAPDAYPGEIAGASQVIALLPYYNQTLRMTAA